MFIETQKYLASPNKLKFTMSGTQKKITRHAKKQEHVTHNEKENQPQELEANYTKVHHDEIVQNK